MKAMDAAERQNAPRGAQRRASCARTLAKPVSKRSRATTGEAGPTKGPGSAAGPRRKQPASRAQRDSHANRARLRREEEPRKAGLGNNGNLAQCGSKHDRAPLQTQTARYTVPPSAPLISMSGMQVGDKVSSEIFCSSGRIAFHATVLASV